MTAIHGFLGLPKDWDDILPAEDFDTLSTPAWISSLKGEHGLPALAQSLNRRAQRDSVLIGYSMGGRIALHMLLEGGAHLWRSAVIVSASPGLKTETERERRAAQDAKWADRFRRDPWNVLMKDWNAQPVFEGEPPLRRDEDDFDREQLANALESGSVGHQADLRQPLRALEIPVLWVAGERDEKYTELAQECAALNPRFQVKILAGAGHRAPWSGTAEFQEAVKEWIQ